MAGTRPTTKHRPGPNACCEGLPANDAKRKKRKNGTERSAKGEQRTRAQPHLGDHVRKQAGWRATFVTTRALVGDDGANWEDAGRGPTPTSNHLFRIYYPEGRSYTRLFEEPPCSNSLFSPLQGKKTHGGGGEAAQRPARSEERHVTSRHVCRKRTEKRTEHTKKEQGKE